MKLKKTGRKRKRSVHAPDLLEELVTDILVRLPVKDLLKYKTVCKAWRKITSDPTFIKEHLRFSASKWKQDPSFIISPHYLTYVISWESIPSTFSNRIRFYQWKDGASAAKLLHAKDFVDEFSRVREFVCCDGLVFAPTDTKLYLFNPATRDSITLPDSNRNNLWLCGPSLCYCAGLGLDPHTGNYKVVQAFYRSVDHDTNIYHMGMEVFTIAGGNGGGGAWREMMNDPPYPAERSQTSVSVKGFMFWHIDKAHSKPQTPWGLLCLNLSDETFSVTGMPDSLDPVLADADDEESSYTVDVVNEELCLTARSSDVGITIWTLRMPDQCWEQRFKMLISHICHPLAFLEGGTIMLRKDQFLYRYDLPSSSLTFLREMNNMRYQGRRSWSWKNIFFFNVNSYVESLVRIISV
ncbi:hypothetical protein QOZ80_2BG0152490 [Eleusine coracana subsp. coracana]|nr:hypothetical protein QOZ80_2BG0152490 [Eleusine coracana subsp. coracana]